MAAGEYERLFSNPMRPLTVPLPACGSYFEFSRIFAAALWYFLSAKFNNNRSLYFRKGGDDSPLLT